MLLFTLKALKTLKNRKGRGYNVGSVGIPEHNFFLLFLSFFFFGGGGVFFSHAEGGGGGCKQFWGSFSHKEGGGGAKGFHFIKRGGRENFYCLELGGGGRKKFRTRDFPIL